MDYMACIEEHFWRAMGLHLNGLRDFMAWIKQGGYYHGLVAQQGHLHKCPHLVGVLLPRQPQLTPSESCRESQKKAENSPTSSSEPSTGATVAPVVEFPVMETPVTQTPVAETPAARSDTPAPMETGKAGDGQSWAEQVEAGIDEEFQHHLTGSAQGLSSLSPLLPEVATTLLPPIKDYVPGVAFEGTRDVRVLDCARTLRVAAWLHRLDMSTGGDGMASETLEALRHNQGPLLDLFLTPMMSNLTFQEVVNRVLHENRCSAQRSLDDLRACHARIHEELDVLIKAHREESDKSS